jgi:Domain of unknown function (DUF3425)
MSAHYSEDSFDLDDFDTTTLGPMLVLPLHQSPFSDAALHKTSDKRRAQNRAAQKTYREKRKRRLQELESLAANAGLIESSTSSKDKQDASPKPSSSSSASPGQDDLNFNLSSSSSQDIFEDQFSFLSPNVKPSSTSPPTQSSTSPSQDDLLFPEFSSSNTTQFPFETTFFPGPEQNIFDGYSVSLSDKSTQSLPTVELLNPAPSIFDFDQIDSEGNMSLEKVDEEIIRKSDSPSSNALVYQGLARFADPQMNYIQMHTARVHWAFWHNMMHLGFGPNVCCEENISHFYRPDVINSINPDAVVKSVKATFANIKPDLRPTKEQIMMRHPGYLDILPFPDIRSRILEITENNPAAFDEDEFWKDIEEEGGLTCWGSIQARPGQSPTGCGAPWDGRSWEAKIWFLTKWSFIVGDDESSLSRSSQWWREMRGVGQGFSF